MLNFIFVNHMVHMSIILTKIIILLCNLINIILTPVNTMLTPYLHWNYEQFSLIIKKLYTKDQSKIVFFLI